MFLQKPLRRVEIEEIKGDVAPSDRSLITAEISESLETQVPSLAAVQSERKVKGEGSSLAAVQSESKVKGEGSSLGSSPSAKIQKIEELPDTVSQPPAK